MYSSYPTYPQNILPPQQILQANGRASINALKMSPNSSALIADQTQPIVWRCVSDSLGNVSAEAFDITPHKDEEVAEKEALISTLSKIEDRLTTLESKYESFTSRRNESQIKANVSANTEHVQPTSISATNAFSKPKV